VQLAKRPGWAAALWARGARISNLEDELCGGDGVEPYRAGFFFEICNAMNDDGSISRWMGSVNTLYFWMSFCSWSVVKSAKSTNLNLELSFLNSIFQHILRRSHRINVWETSVNYR
jgi:hypothetical protein